MRGMEREPQEAGWMRVGNLETGACSGGLSVRYVQT